MPRWIILFCLVAAATIFLWQRISSAPDRFAAEYSAQAEALLGTPAIRVEYTPILEEAIAALSAIDEDFSRFDVNQAPASGEIGLLVVDPDRSAEPLARAARGNFLAVSGRFVLVDKRFIDLLLLNSTVAAYTQLSWEIEAESNERESRLFRLFMEQMRIRQLANTEVWIGNMLPNDGERLVQVHSDLSDPDFRQDIFDIYVTTNWSRPDAASVLRDFNSHFVGPLSYFRSGYDGEPRNFPMQAAVSLPLAGYLYTPLAHELYHVDEGGVSAFLNANFDRGTINDAIAEERAADKYAARKVVDVLEVDTYLEIGPLRQELVLFLEFSHRFFSDFTLSRRMSGLRGLYSYAHVIDIQYNPMRVCGDGGVDGFFDFEDIIDIRPARFPLLSTDELNTLSQRISAERETTHPHALSRRANFDGLEIGASAAGLNAPSALDNPFYEVIGNARDALSYGALEALYSSWANDLSPGDGLAPGHVRAFLAQDVLDQHEVALCPYAQCELYSFDGAWLELGYEYDRIVHLVFLSPHFRSGEGLTAVLNGKTVSLTRGRQETLFRMLQFFVGEIVRQTELPLNQAAGTFIQDLARCGGGSMNVSGNRHHVTATTLDEYYTFRLSYSAGNRGQ